MTRTLYRTRSGALTWLLFSLCLGTDPLSATRPPCRPCGGLLVADPYSVAAALTRQSRLTAESRLYVAWEVPLDRMPSPAAGHALAASGATPWAVLQFRSPAPLGDQLPLLEAEIQAASHLAASRIPRAHYEISWLPEGAPKDPREYAFLVKRASVALLGADPEARVLVGPIPADSNWLQAFYAEEVAAYFDGLILEGGGDGNAEAIASIQGLDPGRPIVGIRPIPAAEAGLLPAEAARESARGFALSLFDARGRQPEELENLLAPLGILAAEFAGDLALDSGLTVAGPVESWAFVRGEDLSLRLVALTPPDVDELTLELRDPSLRAAERVLADGSSIRLGGVRRTSRGLEVRVANPRPVEILRIDRMPIEEESGVAEKLTVAADRQPTVEEILRRLQAAEDRQRQRLRHYEARNATTLRFQAAQGVQAIEATFEGAIYVRQGEPYDWAWQNFFVNGVRWRGEKIPELPLIQPEKAATLPLEIALTRDYRYRLEGEEVARGRRCWVVGFDPAGDGPPGRSLFRGRVWIDQELFVRVRTRAVQLGLEGDVLSNEETVEFFPVDEAGNGTGWTPDSFFLPLRTTGQQLYSVLNTATVVEREVVLSEVRINQDDFDRHRAATMASKATMVRDTAQGLRYLVAQEGSDERVVKEGFDTSKLFALGGVFYDESLDYPLPLAGVNYFDLAFRGTPERQLNAFFGGVLGIVSYADPRLFGTRFDFGADFFAFAVRTSDQLYRNGVEQPREEVRERPVRMTLNLGHPLGSFAKLTASYQLGWTSYARGEETSGAFAIPEDHLTHRGSLTLQASRNGYRAQIAGNYHQRSRWEPWGFPGNPEYDPAARSYLTWEANLAKNWYLPKFRKFGLELNYSGGSDLDRFSKYQFGIFGGNRVHGYQIGKVRAEEALGLHATYGFQLGGLLRLDAVADAAWASDPVSGLERELLAGAGVQGSILGPWQTLISMDIGLALAGPDDGFTVYLVILKLFD